MDRRKFFKGLASLLIAGSAAKVTGVFDGDVSGVMIADTDLSPYSSASFGDVTYEGVQEEILVHGNVTCFDRKPGNILQFGEHAISDSCIPRDGKMHSFKFLYNHNENTVQTWVDGKRV